MLAGEKMGARPDLGYGFQGLGFGTQVNTLAEVDQLAAQVRIKNGFLVAGNQAAFQPAGGVVDEIGPGQYRHGQSHGGFLLSLTVGQLGR